MTNPSDEVEPAPEPVKVPLHERTRVLFAAFLLVGAICAGAAYNTVYSGRTEQLAANGGAQRARTVVTRWMQDGYFHYAGLMVRNPAKVEVYRTSTGAYMVSLLAVEGIYSLFGGDYSWRLAALHNVLVCLVLAALTGVLAFRLVQRLGLSPRLAFVSGAGVVALVFTFPDNLAVFWEMTSQMYWAVFATLFLIAYERSIDGGRHAQALTIVQAASAFVMTLMEPISALAFLASFAATILILEQQPGRWKRFVLLAVLPSIAALGVYTVQRTVAASRFPEESFSGSQLLFRSGFDGESRYYGDHLDIAFRRDVARMNWEVNSESLFRWPSVFFLGAIATLIIVAALIAGRVPRVFVEVLTAMVGAWLLYAAYFSQAILIHPYLYDMMLYTPLALALFALVPALVESMTRRTGAIILVVVFCASWYAMFQMRLYALRYPAPGAIAGAQKP